MKKKSVFIILIIITTLMFNISVIAYAYDEEPDGISSKVIYLTFDDGPSSITEKTLDILKQENVKATFFIIGSQISGNENILKRIYHEGHGIGLHSYTHNFKKIYCCNETFIKEMVKTDDAISKVIGVHTNVIRFPGGSCGKLNDEMLKSIHNWHYRIFDWNIDTRDGLYPKTSPYKLYTRAVNTKKFTSPIFLLLHCDNTHINTCIALPKIIDHFKNKGYEFKVIDKNTNEYFFPYKRS